jgi:hypothetical protein
MFRDSGNVDSIWERPLMTNSSGIGSSASRLAVPAVGPKASTTFDLGRRERPCNL